MLVSQDRDCGRNHDLHTRSVERVIRAMAQRLDLPMSNEEMADIACFSPCHFNRLFHKMTGIPPVQFHYALRIARAKELLIETDMGITEICYEVGYNSLGTFISRFGDMVGLSPTNFRRLARNISGVRLADLPLPQPDLSVRSNGHGIVGTVERTEPKALIFSGTFPRAIPEGQPSSCTIVRDGTKYALPIPSDGLWYVMSMAVPRTYDGIQLLTLKDVKRGRSAPIKVEGGYWSGSSAIRLLPPTLLDPPILAAIPVQIASFCELPHISLRPRRAQQLQPTA